MKFNTGSVTKEANMPRKGTGAGGRPPMPPEEKRVSVAARIKPSLKEKLDSICEARGVTLGQLLEKWLEDEPLP